MQDIDAIIFFKKNQDTLVLFQNFLVLNSQARNSDDHLGWYFWKGD